MRRPGHAEHHTEIRIGELGELQLELIFELELLELIFELKLMELELPILNCIQLPPIPILHLGMVAS